MPFIKANDLNIYYEIHGSGTPLLLIGGYTQHSGRFEAFIKSFSKHFQVIIFDNRGCGQTEASLENYSIELFAQDTIGLLDGLNIESAHLFGESMGTCIIQKMCLDHPERVKKSVLCAPFARLPAISKNNSMELLKLLEKGVDKEAIIRINTSWLLSNAFHKKKENIDQFVKDFLSDPYPQPMEGLLGQAHALFNVDLESDLSKIPHEMLLLVGELDILTPPYCAKLIKDKAPHCEMHIFKQMGHMFNFEIPEKVIKKTLSFLLSQNRNDPSRVRAS